MLPERLTRIVRLLSRLPGVGEKTGQRYALHIAGTDPELGRRLAEALADLAKTIAPCERCGFLAEVREESRQAICAICSDNKRNPELLCIVARIADLLAIERSRAMRGTYFVLGKLVSPLEGVGPDDLPLDKLRERLRTGAVREVLVATPPSVDGEATALLLARELEGSGVRVSRIASGVPHGGDLEFADQVTLGRAIEGRKPLSS